jgi:hypothetical protein
MHASHLAADHPLTGRPLGVVRCRQLAHAQARVYDALEATAARCVVLLVPPACVGATALARLHLRFQLLALYIALQQIIAGCQLARTREIHRLAAPVDSRVA